jgi:EmrB/QacA subfamily drug resistance transporter
VSNASVSATTPSESPALVAIPPEVWRIATVIVFGAFMAGLDTSLVNVGLNNISGHLHASLSSVQWVTSGYLIALAGALPACAWLGRHLGVGRLWLYALVGFTVASGLCAAAPNLTFLIVLRILQGITGGLLIPAGQTVLGRAAGPARMGRVMNTAGIAVVLAPAIGPTIGGLLISYLSWRWLFLVNLPIGAVAVVLGVRIIPRGERGTAGPFDLVGFALVGTGLPLVTYGIIVASQQRTLTIASVLATLPVGIAALATFAWRSLHHQTPILDLRLFTNRVYAAAETSVFFTGAALFGGMIILPLYYELLRGKGLVATGLLLLAYGGGAALSMRLGGRLTDRFGGGVTAMAGLVVTAATTVPFVFLGAHAGLVGIEALQFLRGVGISLAGIPAVSAAYATVARDQLPDATAQANILQRVGGSLGSALFVVILENHGAADTSAFHVTFAWLTATSALALLAAIWLTIEQRRSRSSR